MGLGPLELSGAMSRTQDYATIKQHEDNKSFVNNSHFTDRLNKEVQNRANTVERGNNTNNDQKKFDAKEKGSNQYSGDGGKNHKDNKKEDRDCMVRPKGATSTFDIRI